MTHIKTSFFSYTEITGWSREPWLAGEGSSIIHDTLPYAMLGTSRKNMQGALLYTVKP